MHDTPRGGLSRHSDNGGSQVKLSPLVSDVGGEKA
jgi:hypothetical protein